MLSQELDQKFGKSVYQRKKLKEWRDLLINSPLLDYSINRGEERNNTAQMQIVICYSQLVSLNASPNPATLQNSIQLRAVQYENNRGNEPQAQAEEILLVLSGEINFQQLQSPDPPTDTLSHYQLAEPIGYLRINEYIMVESFSDIDSLENEGSESHFDDISTIIAHSPMLILDPDGNFGEIHSIYSTREDGGEVFEIDLELQALENLLQRSRPRPPPQTTNEFSEEPSIHIIMLIFEALYAQVALLDDGGQDVPLFQDQNEDDAQFQHPEAEFGHSMPQNLIQLSHIQTEQLITEEFDVQELRSGTLEELQRNNTEINPAIDEGRNVYQDAPPPLERPQFDQLLPLQHRGAQTGSPNPLADEKSLLESSADDYHNLNSGEYDPKCLEDQIQKYETQGDLYKGNGLEENPEIEDETVLLRRNALVENNSVAECYSVEEYIIGEDFSLLKIIIGYIIWNIINVYPSESEADDEEEKCDIPLTQFRANLMYGQGPGIGRTDRKLEEMVFLSGFSLRANGFLRERNDRLVEEVPVQVYQEIINDSIEFPPNEMTVSRVESAQNVADNVQYFEETISYQIVDYDLEQIIVGDISRDGIEIYRLVPDEEGNENAVSVGQILSHERMLEMHPGDQEFAVVVGDYLKSNVNHYNEDSTANLYNAHSRFRNNCSNEHSTTSLNLVEEPKITTKKDDTGNQG